MANARSALGRTRDRLPTAHGVTIFCWAWLSVAGCGGGDGHPAYTGVAVPSEPDARTQPSQIDSPNARCRIDERYLADYKQCAVDTDCELIAYHPTCCTTRKLAGIARRDHETVTACLAAERPRCACDEEPERAEDGRVASADATTVIAQCVAGRCMSHVDMRDCGRNKVCAPTELCVVYGNVPGSPLEEDAGPGENVLVSYQCEPNPCSGELSCDCAQDVCAQRDDALRKCELERSSDADIACVPYVN